MFIQSSFFLKKHPFAELVSFQWNNEEQNIFMLKYLHNASSPPQGVKSPIETYLRGLQETRESKL